MSTKITAKTTEHPITTGRSRWKIRSRLIVSSSMAYPWIKESVQDIDHKIDEHKDHGEDYGASHHNGQVALEDPISCDCFFKHGVSVDQGKRTGHRPQD